MSFFKKPTQKEKFLHYDGIVKGTVDVKKSQNFSNAEQKAYAKGQVDARNEQKRIFAYKNSSPEQRKEYAKIQREKRVEYTKNKCK